MSIRKHRNSLLLVVLLFLVTVGYAVLTSNLKIIGTANIKSNTWDVHFENLRNQSGVIPSVEPYTDNTTTTELEFTVDLDLPGDYYQFNVDAVNDGSIDAMVDLATTIFYRVTDGEPGEDPVETQLQEKPNYINFSVTYDDDTEILPNHLLAKNGGTETYKVRIEYNENIVSQNNEKLRVKMTIPYIQATDEAEIRVGADFTTSSWDEIISSYKAGKTDTLMQNLEDGALREVNLDLDHDGIGETVVHLRIANLSTPDECRTQGFSQSACGFVLEFADIFESRRINPYNNSVSQNGNGTKGGWKYSEMRAYLNSSVYAASNYDYKGIGLIDALPSDLKSKIIDTLVISGHSLTDDANFETIDMLYLLSTKELYGKEGTVRNVTTDTSEIETRQLDFYRIHNVTTAEYNNPNSYAIKRNINGDIVSWWLRSVEDYCDYYSFFASFANGSWNIMNPSNFAGVSPAFRIAIED